MADAEEIHKKTLALMAAGAREEQRKFDELKGARKKLKIQLETLLVLDIKKRGRKQVVEKLEKMEKFGNKWDLDYINAASEYYATTFLDRYLQK